MTTVAVYSLRAKRERSYASMPITWEELEKAMRTKDAGALDFAAEQAVGRLKRRGDLFAPVLTRKQKLPKTHGACAQTGRLRRPVK